MGEGRCDRLAPSVAGRHSRSRIAASAVPWVGAVGTKGVAVLLLVQVASPLTRRACWRARREVALPARSDKGVGGEQVSGV